MISIIGILGIFPIAIVFGICFGLTLRSYLKNPNISILYFTISFFSIALIYFVWGLRVLFIPQFESDTKVLYPMWAFIYVIGALALISLDFATLDLTYMKESNFFKFIKAILLVSFVGVLILAFIGFNVEFVELLVFMDVTDLAINNPYVYLYAIIIILFYIFFPNAIFIIYLIKWPSKTDFQYKKLRIIEIGILLWTICFALDGIKFPSNIGILIIRIFLMIGGLITMKGLLMKPTSE